MNDATRPQLGAADGTTVPLQYPHFRRIWFASLLSNLGAFVQSVAAAWAMTQMTSSADKVAQVQTALMLPYMLISMPAGAVADMYDRRIVAIIALALALVGATTLTALALFDLVGPNSLLALCFVMGTGMALMVPAWQSSIREQVPVQSLPAAVALNGISFNIARSVGPAVGGAVVAMAGTVSAFALNALLYLPLTAALWQWKRIPESSKLPREGLGRAMVSGVRYIAHSPSMKILLTRSMATGVIGGSISALMPLVVRDLLHGDAVGYGIMLSAYGVGAVLGAFAVKEIRRRMNDEAALRACVLSMSVSIAVVAFSHNALLTAAALVLTGAAWMMAWALFGIGVQLSAPSWVAGRALAAYQGAATGGVAIGSWGWGKLTDLVGVEASLLVSAVLMLGSGLIGLWLRMPPIGSRDEEAEMLEHPQAQMSLTERSGPVVVEIEYRVALEKTPAFHKVMNDVQLFRMRNGAYGWSLACDIADPELWTERYHCPTWMDYLRQRNRATRFERELDRQASGFHSGPGPVRVRRMLERHFGTTVEGSQTNSCYFK